MVTKIDISSPVNVEVCDAGFKVDNIITLSFMNAHTDLYLELSEDNFEELKQVINSK